MKKFVLQFVFILSVITVHAQMCDGYYPSTVGQSWEVTNYNARDKVESVQKNTVLSAEQSDGGLLVTISATTYDNSSKELSSHQFTTFCKDGSFSVDMKAFLDPGTMQSEDIQLEIEASNMDIPTKVEVGQKLPDSWMKISMQMEGMPNMMSQSINIKNRIVEGFETITTPAGTFNCVKISYDTELKTMFTIKAKTIAWYAIGAGVVRMENFDSKGKPQSYSLLTKLSK